jgi:hypothetical protein
VRGEFTGGWSTAGLERAGHLNNIAIGLVLALSGLSTFVPLSQGARGALEPIKRAVGPMLPWKRRLSSSWIGTG